MTAAYLFKKILLATVCAVYCLVIVVQPVFAQFNVDPGDNDINYYDPRGNASCTGGGTISVTNGSDNEQTIFLTMLANGFTKQQAAAALGNLNQESGFNPRNIEPNGAGHGIVQWSEPGRWDLLTKYASSQNKDPYDLGLQISFMLYELHGSFANFFKDFQSKTTLADQVSDWANNYEIAGIIGPRLQDAQIVMQQPWYQSAPDNGGAAGANGTNNSGTNCLSIGTGDFVNHFVVYNQADPAWGNKPYGDGTIAANGCGPSAMAMIITNLTGQRVTPDIVAAYADSQHLYVNGSGSSWQIGPVVAAHWNLKATFVGADLNSINNALASGALIIMPGAGGLPFTSGGHFVVVRAVTADGKWLVGDSGHTDTNTMLFDPQQMLSEAHAGGIYAISK